MSAPLFRINKYLADKGYATRRGADVLIQEGKVIVNGKKAVLGQKVSEEDLVEILGGTNKKYRYFAYYKPTGVITHSPGEGEIDIRTRVFRDHHLSGLFPIGRLDKHSEGLILLTDDGRITERLLSPKFEHEKEYRVTVDKRITKYFLNLLERGVNIEGYVTKRAKTSPVTNKPLEFDIVLTEGKKHQIRRMCAALGYQIQKLVRTRILSLELSMKKAGDIVELTETEQKKLFTTLGLR